MNLAKDEGGTVITGGQRVQPKGYEGYFIAPTIIEGLSYDCRTNQEEIFGPVVTIIPFDSEDEVIKMANSTEYGLSATIWTSNLNKANRISRLLESGIVGSILGFTETLEHHLEA